MFKIKIEENVDYTKVLDIIEETLLNKGKISIKDVAYLVNPSMNDTFFRDDTGWGIELLDLGIMWMQDSSGSIFLHLPDPKSFPYQNDIVSNPGHYTEGRKYEPRKVIADWKLGFNLGNAVKYISRAGRKNDAVEDLKKAIQYIEFEIEDLTGGDQNE